MSEELLLDIEEEGLFKEGVLTLPAKSRPLDKDADGLFRVFCELFLCALALIVVLTVCKLSRDEAKGLGQSANETPLAESSVSVLLKKRCRHMRWLTGVLSRAFGDTRL